MSAQTIGFALLLLGLILLVAKFIRVKWQLMQRFFIPSSVIGGAIALILGPEVLGRVAPLVGLDGVAESGVFPPVIISVWEALPGLLISVVFAALFLGHPIPRIGEAARLAGPQLAFGTALASGQYVLGLLLAVLVLAPIFGLPPLTGALIEIGFEGGHGTAAGLGDTFDRAGFPEGQDLALGLATIGLLSGVVFGIILINWGVRTGRTAELRTNASPSVSERKGLVGKENRPAAARLTVHPSSIEPMALHFGLIAVAVLLGQLLLWALQWLETRFWADQLQLFEYVPLFPLAMLGGIVVQLVVDRFDHQEIVDRLMVERLQGFALDALIVSALATLSLQVIAANWIPFTLLSVTGLLWALGMFVFLARRMIPDYWFERGIADMGQSLGVTATGLILLRVVDPDLRTPAYAAFGYKQLLLEPFFGGGLVTAAAIPLIVQYGPYGMLVGMSLLLVFSLMVGLLYFGRRSPESPQATAAPE